MSWLDFIIVKEKFFLQEHGKHRLEGFSCKIWYFPNSVYKCQQPEKKILHVIRNMDSKTMISTYWFWKLKLRNLTLVAEERVQQLRAFLALSGDVGSVISTLMKDYNHCNLVPGVCHPLLAPMILNTNCAHTYMQSKHSYP